MSMRPLALLLALVSFPVFAATKTWNGSVSGSWHTAANWTPSALPANGDDLVFPSGAANKTTTNDFPAPALQVASVTLSGSGYTLAGNGIFLVGAITASYAVGSSTVSLPVEVSGSQTFSVTSQLASLAFSSGVQIDGGLGVGGSGSVTLSGVVSGPGGLTYSPSAATASLTLSGANTYMGPTGVNSGTLVVQNASALGSTGSGTIVALGATLRIQGDIALAAEPLQLQGTLQNASGTNSFPGTIALLSTAQVTMTSGELTLSGAISGSHGLDVVSAPGTSYRCVLAGNNTFSGPLVFTGTIRALGSAALGSGPVSCSGPLGVLEIDGGGLQFANPLTFGSQTCALHNILGNNQWDGTIQLPGGSPPNPFVTVDSGTLTLSNVVSNDNFTKAGPGLLTLQGNDVDPVVTLQVGSLGVEGFLKGVILQPGTLLGGSGTVGTIDANAGGIIAPGPFAPPFVSTLTTNGNLSLGAGNTFQVTLAPSGHDELVVKAPSTVSLGNATLTLSNQASDPVYSTIRILDNQGAAPISGTFAGLPEGAYLASGGSEFRITYLGAGGNDVTLTVVPPPSVTINVVGNPQACQPGGVSLNAIPHGGSLAYQSYQWYLNGGALGGANGATYVPQVPGSFSVTVTDSIDVTSPPSASVDVGDTAAPMVSAPASAAFVQTICQ